MTNKKVLIIGGNRLTGQHLARELIRNNYEVTLLNRGMRDDGLGNFVK